jgi:hypothetical protein
MSQKNNMVKTIPENCIKVFLNHWGCGDECCCNYLEIRAKLKDYKYDVQLWESYWWNEGLSEKELEELRIEVIEACQQVGIVADLSDEYPSEWTGERFINEKEKENPST